MAKVDLSVVLACYNEGPTLRESVKKIIKVLETLKRSWEIIFVEDKSTDETCKNVENLTGQIKNSGFGGQARAIYHVKNQGRGKTVTDGLRAARGDICGYLDVDLEVSASYIPLFVAEVEKGFDLVVGKRFYEGQGSIIRFLASKIYTLIVRFLFKTPVEDTEAGYKFFRRSKILPVLAKVRDKKWFWDTEICIRAHLANLSISQIPVLFVRRADKKSTVRLLPDTWAYLTKVVKFKWQVH